MVPLATWTIEDALPAFFDLLSNALSLLNTVLKAVAPYLEALWVTFLQPIAQWTGGVVVQVIENVALAFQWLAQVIAENQWVADIIGLIGTLLMFWALGATLAAAATALLNAPLLLVVAGIALIIAVIVELCLHWENLKLWAIDCWQSIIQWLQLCWEDLTATWQGASLWFSTKVIGPIKNFFLTFWNWLKAAAQDAWNGISLIWQTVAQWFDLNVIQPVSGFFLAMWEGIKSAFTSAWDFMSSAFKVYINGWLSLLEGFINFVIDGINTLIRALNKIQISVPSWVPGFGGKSWGINISTIDRVAIPRLAQGAVIPPNREFLAVLGDQPSGTNIEAPLDTIVEAFRTVLGESRSSSGDIVLQINGKTFARLMGPYNQAESRRRGVKLVTGGI